MTDGTQIAPSDLDYIMVCLHKNDRRTQWPSYYKDLTPKHIISFSDFVKEKRTLSSRIMVLDKISIDIEDRNYTQDANGNRQYELADQPISDKYFICLIGRTDKIVKWLNEQVIMPPWTNKKKNQCTQINGLLKHCKMDERVIDIDQIDNVDESQRGETNTTETTTQKTNTDDKKDQPTEQKKKTGTKIWTRVQATQQTSSNTPRH